MSNDDRIRTHWDGCWRSRDHHECAVARVERLEDEVEYLRSRCERRDGDPTVEEMTRWATSAQVAPSLRDIARALLRAWGEET